MGFNYVSLLSHPLPEGPCAFYGCLSHDPVAKNNPCKGYPVPTIYSKRVTHPPATPLTKEKRAKFISVSKSGRIHVSVLHPYNSILYLFVHPLRTSLINIPIQTAILGLAALPDSPLPSSQRPIPSNSTSYSASRRY